MTRERGTGRTVRQMKAKRQQVSPPRLLRCSQVGDDTITSGNEGDNLKLVADREWPNDGRTTINFGGVIIPSGSVAWYGTALFFTRPLHVAGTVTVKAVTSIGTTNTVNFTCIEDAAIPDAPSDLTQKIGMVCAGWGASGTPEPQSSYPPLANPWLAHQIRWGLAYLEGPHPSTNDSSAQVNWGPMMLVGNQTGGNYWFMEKGGRINYSVGILPFRTSSNPYVRLVHDGANVADLAYAATGVWDARWVQFAQGLVANHNVSQYPNMGEIWLTLGWELNQGTSPAGKWFGWGVSSLAEARSYAQYWRKIVTAMRTVSNRFRFCWNVNGGAGPANIPGVLDPYVSPTSGGAYPGDAYVDACGMEMYDNVLGSYARDGAGNLTTSGAAAAWSAGLNGTYGYAWMDSFCRSHDKFYAVPEWGLSDPAHAGGGDNPVFIQNFSDYVEAMPKVAWVNYFNIDKSDGLHHLDRFPNAKAKFRAVW